jgi:hypothetical protein
MQKVRCEKCNGCDNYRDIDCEPEIVGYTLDEDRQTVSVLNCEECKEFDCEYWDEYNSRMDENQIESYCYGCCG